MESGSVSVACHKTECGSGPSCFGLFDAMVPGLRMESGCFTPGPALELVASSVCECDIC